MSELPEAPAKPDARPFRSGMIAIVGRPNVGKSTLLNRILQEKIAITSKTPQTTRHRILGVRTLPAAQLVLLDTPGIHKPKYRLNQRMVQVALESIQGADLILLLVEASEQPGAGDRYTIQAIKKARVPVILVINKMDLVKKNELLPLMDLFRKEHDFAELIPVSALTGENVDHLVENMVRYIPEGGPLYPEDTLTDQPMRALTSEIIREKILQRTREEIPYAVAVLLEEFREEEAKNLTVIKATILVERTSQKRIIIGEGGRMLKEVGQEARAELEAKLGRKVYLELWVKVRKNWRQDERILRELGY
ncbi:MAG TPA: GTPase Era [Nitrospiria bacterium]|nr:GTPase Era [Nitrospiria bacterium]